MNAEVNIVLYWPGNNRLATRTNTPRGNVVKIDTCFFTLFYLYKTEIQCLKFSIFRHIVCSPISESFSKFVKIGFWQLKKIQIFNFKYAITILITNVCMYIICLRLYIVFVNFSCVTWSLFIIKFGIQSICIFFNCQNPILTNFENDSDIGEHTICLKIENLRHCISVLEKLTNTIYNLKQMIYMHTFVIKIVMAYLKLNRILIFDHFKDMYLYFRLKDI
jgi:hypothetical protein